MDGSSRPGSNERHGTFQQIGLTAPLTNQGLRAQVDSSPAGLEGGPAASDAVLQTPRCGTEGRAGTAPDALARRGATCTISVGKGAWVLAHP
jgi:hypothetical protein